MSEREIFQQHSLAEVPVGTEFLNDIDDGIKDAVESLIAFGIETDGSCEGHLDHSLPYPWIFIRTQPSSGWFNSEELQDEWRKRNIQNQIKLQILLDEFYGGIDDHDRLEIGDTGNLGGCRLEPITKERSESVLQRSRAEMKMFSEFVRSKIGCDD